MAVEILCEQGGPGWFRGRAGAITASMFKEVRRTVGGLTDQQEKYIRLVASGISRSKAANDCGYKTPPRGNKIERALDGESVGDWSNAAHDYAFRLAIERISGEPLQDERYQGYAAQRGHELEPEARDIHSFIVGSDVERVGVVRSPDGRFGASADGYIGDRIGCEYKCFTSPEKIRPVLFDFDIQDVRDQMQGGMWLTGRDEWHLGLYCPFLEPIGRDFTLIVERRDDEYIAALVKDLEAFDSLVEQYKTRLQEQE